MTHTMSAEHLHVFTARSNPLGWKQPHKHWETFARHMLDCGVHLHVAEVAYGNEPFQCDNPRTVADHDELHRFHHYGFRAKTRGWVKESVLNQAIQRVPEARYIGWTDSDIFFRDVDGGFEDNWASRTVRALQHYDVVQNWSDALDLGPRDEIIAHHKSFCWQFWSGQPVVPQGPKFWHGDGGVYAYPHSGYSWAITREAFDLIGGLFHLGYMGSGDHHMALAMVGHADSSMPAGTHDRYREHVKRWEARALQHINQNIGVVQGTIEHAFHGTKPSRAYIPRWKMFVDHGFNPDEDLRPNSYGVMEFASNKPELRRAFDRYLAARSEDVNHI